MSEPTPATKVVTRFAPSPTGFLHAGAYRTAIFSYLYARKHKGKFILRIEDTDKERSKKAFENDIKNSLEWLGLEYDNYFLQSQNAERHKAILEKMISDGHAYISKEEAKDGSGVIKEIVRFKNPNTDVTFTDEIKGSVTMHTADLGDFVIAKNISEPLFHLAVVVDDFDEGVTHVIRGEDHVSNTPRQILIQRAIGAPTPIYAHLPLVLGTDKQKLSKRRGALALSEYRAQGYLPGAILNMVAMIGWNPGTEQEIFSKEELINAFELSRVQKSAAVFNPEKLNWMNKEYIKGLPREEQIKLLFQFLPHEISQLPTYDAHIIERLAPILIDHITHFDELEKMAAAGDLTYYFAQPTYEKERLFWKDEHDQTKLIERLTQVRNTLVHLNEESFIAGEGIKAALWPYAESEGRGQVLWPMRYALSGREKSPDPFQLASILGKKEVLERLNHAIALYS